MLRIQRASDSGDSSKTGDVLLLSGRIHAEDLAELERFLMEAADRAIALDLSDVTLVDRDAVKFLAGCEERNIQLRSCPAYIREWIDAETGAGSR